jgi:hypothetical protein
MLLKVGDTPPRNAAQVVPKCHKKSREYETRLSRTLENLSTKNTHTQERHAVQADMATGNAKPINVGLDGLTLAIFRYHRRDDVQLLSHNDVVECERFSAGMSDNAAKIGCADVFRNTTKKKPGA